MLKIHVEGVPAQVRETFVALALEAVPICLQRPTGIFAELMAPPGEHVAGVSDFGLGVGEDEWRGSHRTEILPPGFAAKEIPLKRDRVPFADLPIEAQTAAGSPPSVVGIAHPQELPVTRESFPVNAVVEIAADRAAVAEGAEAAFLGASTAAEDPALGVLGRLRDDVDDAVDSVGPPHARPRPANHLDPLDIFQGIVHGVPIDARRERIVNGSPIHLDQQLAVEAIIESARADGPLVVVDAGHVHARHHAKQLRKGRRARTTDVLRRDDKHGRRRFTHGALPPRDRRDFDAHELFHAQLLQIVGRREGLPCLSEDAAHEDDETQCHEGHYLAWSLG